MKYRIEVARLPRAHTSYDEMDTVRRILRAVIQCRRRVEVTADTTTITFYAVYGR